MKQRHKVITPNNVRPAPKDFEVSAAQLLANHFKRDVIFIARSLGKTPDVEIGHTKWEIKSPKGSGKRTIQHQIYRALKQSENVVIDVRAMKVDSGKIMSHLQYQFRLTKNLKRLLTITKSGKVIEFKRRDK